MGRSRAWIVVNPARCVVLPTTPACKIRTALRSTAARAAAWPRAATTASPTRTRATPTAAEAAKRHVSKAPTATRMGTAGKICSAPRQTGCAPTTPVKMGCKAAARSWRTVAVAAARVARRGRPAARTQTAPATSAARTANVLRRPAMTRRKIRTRRPSIVAEAAMGARPGANATRPRIARARSARLAVASREPRAAAKHRPATMACGTATSPRWIAVAFRLAGYAASASRARPMASAKQVSAKGLVGPGHCAPMAS